MQSIKQNLKQNQYMLLHTLFTRIKKLLDLEQNTTSLYKATKRILNYYTKNLGLKSIINNFEIDTKFRSNAPSA